MSGANERAYLAFDLGASSGRAVLGRTRGDGSLELEEVSRFANAPVVADDGVYWDLKGLFGAMVQAMTLVAQRDIRPAAVGVDTWGVDFGLLGADGKLLERPHCYRDRRHFGKSRVVAERIGAARLQARTGSMFQDHASLCQFLAARERTPQVLAKARLLLFIPDLLRSWMCGREDGRDGPSRSTDCTAASTSQMYDSAARQWARDIVEELDLPADILPPVLTGPSIVGTLSAELQRQIGLGPVPIVSGCGHDTGAAFGICRPSTPLGAGGDLPPADDLVVVSTGTWAILGIFVDRQLPPASLDPTLFGYETNPDGSLRLIRNLTGGWLLEQCRKEWSASRAGRPASECERTDQGRGQACPPYSYDVLISAARAAEGSPGASAILDNQWEGFTHPSSMTAAIVEHCRLTGQRPPRQPGEFAHVIFASLAESYAQAIRQLREKTDRPLRNLYMIGGMARNAYLNELAARRCGVNVIVGPPEATALGNIAVQMAALGKA